MAAPEGLELIACCRLSASDALSLQVTLLVAVTGCNWLLAFGPLVALDWPVGLADGGELQAAMTAIERTTAAG
jgi:hypothetical protein